MKAKTVKRGDLAVKIIIGVLCAFLIIYTLSILFMLLWGLLSSLKSGMDFKANRLGLPKLNDPSWPKGIDDPRSSYYTLFRLKNYVDVINNFSYDTKTSYFIGTTEVGVSSSDTFISMFLNSLLYSLGNGLVQALFPAIMAYMCAKYPYKFSKIIYMVVLVVMTLPIVGAYPSELRVLRNLGLYNTWYGNFIQRCSFLGMYFLVFYEFFKSMPDTYSEAADIDGASQFTIMVGIYMPLAIKMIGSVFLIRFIFFWNDFASIELYMPTHPTLAYFIYVINVGAVYKSATDPTKIAACMILAVPTIILFLLLHNRLMGSMTLGGIKG